MNITIKQLKVFLSIVNHGNMTAAADSINMTKGALSQSLAELETQLGEPIFDRRNSRLYLNQAGTTLIPLADEILSRMKFIEDEFSQHQSTPKITIGCTKSIGSFFLPNLLQQFEAQHHWLPEIIIENVHSIQELLTRFELDIALLESSAIDSSLQHEFWQKDEMVIVASIHHPLAQLESVSYEQLNQERWILREANSASRKFFDHQLAIHFHQPFEHLILNSFDAILLSVFNQLGITFISKACLDNPFYKDHLVQLNTDDQFLRNFNIVYSKEKYLSPPIQQFIQFIQAHKLM